MAECRFPYAGVWPQVAEDAFIAPSAVLVGAVSIGARSSVWFQCVLRADSNIIRVGEGTNIQDGTIVHVDAGSFPTIIGNRVTVGHAAIVHACTLHDGAFVGMGATVLDGAVIEAGGMLAAGSLLAPGKRIGASELWRGSPAQLVRVLGAEERAHFAAAATRYVELAKKYRVEMTASR